MPIEDVFTISGRGTVVTGRIETGIVNTGDDKIKAFYNTCRHRGAPVTKEKKGKAKLLVCTFHGWSYDLDGNLINLREPRDFVDLDKGLIMSFSLKTKII